MEKQTPTRDASSSKRINQVQRRPGPSPSAAHPLLGFGGSIGNLATQRLIHSGYIQAKLQVSTPEDESEQEADHVADEVMRMEEPASTDEEEAPEVQTKPVGPQITRFVNRQSAKPAEEEEEQVVAAKRRDHRAVPVAIREDDDDEEEWQPGDIFGDSFIQPEFESGADIRRQKEGEDEEEEPGFLSVQRSRAHAPHVTPVALKPLQAGGSSLPHATRAFFEPRFGFDFSHVRVHTGSQAAESARSINARAFTIGRNITFGAGQFDPGSPQGRRLLAHELTHTIQQGTSNQVAKIARTPDDEVRLNALPLSASKTKPLLHMAFSNVYSDAIVPIQNFVVHIEDACVQSLEGINLGANGRQAVNAAAEEIANVSGNLNISGTDTQFDLASALMALYELLPSDAFKTNFFGFEYMYGRLVEHSAKFTALTVQEFVHGAEIAADQGLSSVAETSDIVPLYQDLERMISALGDGRSLMMLELEGLVQRMAQLRAEYSPSASADEQRQNHEQRSELSRRALLINDQLIKLMDQNAPATPLDTTVKEQVANFAKTAKSEEDTKKELGDTTSLLAPQPLNMAERVDDPYFKESGLSEEAESKEIAPGHAFPKTLGRFMTESQTDLTERINRQSEALHLQMNKIIPPPEQAKFTLKEFADVYKHWYSLFSVEQEKENLKQSGSLDIWTGMHRATGIATLQAHYDVALGLMRYQIMKMAMKALDYEITTGVDFDFDQITRLERLRRSQELTGSRASDARYEFAELYSNTGSRSRFGEESSRQNVSTQRSTTTAEQFSRVAKLPDFLQTQGAFTQGLTKKPLQVLGLRTVKAQEGWSYLIGVEHPLSGKTVAYEHKVATPEIAEYLLAYRQHVSTLKDPHSAKVSVRKPHKTGYTQELRPVGGVPAFEAVPTSASTDLERADTSARAAIGMPGRGSKSQEKAGSELVQRALLDYLNTFFQRSESAMRVAAIFHIMNVEHGIGKTFDKMFDPSEIAQVLAKAFAFGFGLSILSSLGPIGAALSTGISKAMKIAGGSDITAGVTVAGYLKEASAVETFLGARKMGYIGLPVIQDIQQLFESAISLPAAVGGQKAAKATVKAVLDRISMKPPQTVAEAMDVARQLADVSPEVRKDMLAATDAQIADLRSKGAGTTHSNKDLEIMLAFRDVLQQQSTAHQILDPYKTKLDYTKPDPKQTPFIDPDFKLRTPGERATLLQAMGNLAGKVPLVEDPTLKGGTVKVYYTDGKVRLHVGKDATAKDVELHMPTVHTLRKYEGIGGTIRIMLERAVSMLAFTNTPGYGKRGFEAKLEVEKLTRIRDYLLSQKDAMDLNGRKLQDNEIDRKVIDQHILDINKQILEHTRDLDSMEAGVGFVAARKPSEGEVEAKALGLDTPTGHFWRKQDGQLVLVQQDPKTVGKFVNQDILKAERDKIARGEPGDPKLAIRDASEQVSAGKRRARDLGLGEPPTGHVWTMSSAGVLGLARKDNKAPHVWFDYDGYSKATDKSNPKAFIKSIAEKADSNSDSAQFSAKTWEDAFKELGGEGTTTSFGKFTAVLQEFGVSKIEIIEQMKMTPKGAARDPSPEGLKIRTVRSTTKQHYVEEVLMRHLDNEVSLRQSPLYQQAIQAGKSETDALIIASHERLLTISRKLSSEDKGSLGERWYQWFAQKTDEKIQFKTQFAIPKKDYPEVQQDRSIDFLHKVNDTEADLREIKNVTGSLNDPRLKSEMLAHLALKGKRVKDENKEYTVRRVVWGILDPATLKETGSKTFIKFFLDKGAEFEVHTPDGVKKVTMANYDQLVTLYAGKE